jgi:hypothetical protein
MTAAILHGDLQTAFKKIQVQILTLTGKTTRYDLRTTVVNRRAQHPVTSILQGHKLTVLWISKGFKNLGGVHPVVAMKKPGAWLDNETCHDVAAHARSLPREVNACD